MRYLGLDYGDKRIGIAVSDETETFAFPRVVLRNTEKVFDEIKEICAEEGIGKIIVGIPVSFSAAKNKHTDKIIEFGKNLESALIVPVEFVNEIFSTKIAYNAGSSKEKIDQSAAAVILQGYLDWLRKTNKNNSPYSRQQR